MRAALKLLLRPHFRASVRYSVAVLALDSRYDWGGPISLSVTVTAGTRV